MAKYYVNIPAEVKHDKSLSCFEKLLFGEILALCSKEGYCWATNKYFAGMYNKDSATISRYISRLKNKSIIDVEINKQDGNKRIITTRFFINNKHSENASIGIDELDNSYDKNRQELPAKPSIPIDGFDIAKGYVDAPQSLDRQGLQKIEKPLNNTYNNTSKNTREEYKTPQTPHISHFEKSELEETLEVQKLPKPENINEPKKPTEPKGFISKDGVLTSPSGDDDDKPKRNSWAEFERFWEAYPNATRHQATFQLYQNLIFQKLLPPIDELLVILEKHKKRWDDPKYVPASYNWLKDHRWEDKALPSKKEEVNEFGVPLWMIEKCTATEISHYMLDNNLSCKIDKKEG